MSQKVSRVTIVSRKAKKVQSKHVKIKSATTTMSVLHKRMFSK